MSVMLIFSTIGFVDTYFQLQKNILSDVSICILTFVHNKNYPTVCDWSINEKEKKVRNYDGSFRTRDAVMLSAGAVLINDNTRPSTAHLSLTDLSRKKKPEDFHRH